MENINLLDKMEKVTLMGLLLLPQVRKQMFGCYIFKTIFKTNAPLPVLFLQAKSSLGCHSHFDLVNEEEKCMNDLLLFKSHKTGE